MDKKKSSINVTSIGERTSGFSLTFLDEIKNVNVIRNTEDGKNEISVSVNDQLVFKYDSNFKGEYDIVNDIQVHKGQHEKTY